MILEESVLLATHTSPPLPPSANGISKYSLFLIFIKSHLLQALRTLSCTKFDHVNFGTQFGAEISRQVINKLGSRARQKAQLLGLLNM